MLLFRHMHAGAKLKINQLFSMREDKDENKIVVLKMIALLAFTAFTLKSKIEVMSEATGKNDF